jgi:hypothetical protein
MALRSPPTRWIIRRMERFAFNAASRIVLNTERCRTLYVDAYAGRIPAARFSAIRNAFDLTLFAPAESRRPAAFTLLHFGSFRGFVPGGPLLRGFARFVELEGLSPATARLVVMGRPREEELAVAAGLGLTPYVDYRAAVPYRESLTVLRGADVLVLSNSDAAPVIPSKLYDYLAARRPVLSLSGEDESNRIVVETGSGLSADPHNPEAVASALRELRARTRGPDWGELPPDAVHGFTAERQAARFAEVLQEVTAV